MGLCGLSRLYSVTLDVCMYVRNTVVVELGYVSREKREKREEGEEGRGKMVSYISISILNIERKTQ